jgi:hypothetical protein
MPLEVLKILTADITTTLIRTSAMRNGPIRRKIPSSACRINMAISGP